MKKSFLAALLFMILPLGFLMASGQQDDAKNPDVITIGVFDELEDAYGAIIATDDFKAKFPGVTVKLSKMDWDGHHERLVSVIAAGAGANDIEVIDEGFIGQFVTGGGFTDLSQAPFTGEADVKKLAPFAAANARTEDNALIALPVDIAPAVMFYRKEMAEKSGYDFANMASWNEYLEAGSAVTKDRDNDGAADQWMLSSAQELALVSINNGIGCWIDDKGQLLQPKEKFTSILEMVAEIDEKGIHADYEAWTEPWEAGYSSGSFATSLMGAWFAGALKGWMASDQVGEWRVGYIPGGSYINMGGSFMGIPESVSEEKKPLAYDILRYICTNQDAQMSTLDMIGSFPALVSCFDDPRMAGGDEYFGGQEVKLLYADVAKNIPAVSSGEYDQMARGFWQSAVNGVVAGEYTPDEAYQYVLDNLKASMD
ncbi:MAG: carbohydrate ABC transporter substrate-binding protein [Spirochaetales bacterium]|nr:carbohydrate ABC transporter substrate-binding protein [Spirochaetales bacterium]